MAPTKDTTDDSSQLSQIDSVEIPSPGIYNNKKLLDQQQHDVEESPSLVLMNEGPEKDRLIKITANDDGRLKGGMNRSN